VSKHLKIDRPLKYFIVIVSVAVTYGIAPATVKSLPAPLFTTPAFRARNAVLFSVVCDARPVVGAKRRGGQAFFIERLQGGLSAQAYRIATGTGT